MMTMEQKRSGRGPRGRGRRHQEPPITSTEELRSWFAGNLDDDWFTDPVSIRFDRDEIVVTGNLATPKTEKGDDASLAAHARINAHREDTRDQRIAIADRAQATFHRKVSWAATCDKEQQRFAAASAPVMTRLHFDDRATLDTLIDAGVARSRSEALAWCVRLVAENESDWLERLRQAMTGVEELRDQGPSSRSDA